ncbi:MAG: hypothetical protein PHY02_00245 [Phycisphaerae bacterium]|nr:hypothetical protein [Phycisphaerae bacterium]
MEKAMRRAIFWGPRVLCILFAVFVSLFALDVFDAGYSFWKTILALLIHLIPTGIILIVLAISWRWEWVGAIVFIALGVWYIVMSHCKFVWHVYLVMSGPMFLLGVLFLINWVCRKEIRG